MSYDQESLMKNIKEKKPLILFKENLENEEKFSADPIYKFVIDYSSDIDRNYQTDFILYLLNKSLTIDIWDADN